MRGQPFAAGGSPNSRKQDVWDFAEWEVLMKSFFATLAVLFGIGFIPVMAQSDYPAPDRDDHAYVGEYQGRLSADDQREFNEHYEEWQKANIENDRDDIDQHARKMEEIMARYRIPIGTPFDTIATSTGTTAQRDISQYQGRFSKDDQKRFDEAYEDWVEHRRHNDRDDEGKMLEIMARYNIPRDIPYNALASGARGYSY